MKQKIPESIYEEIANLKDKLKNYERWKKEDEDKIKRLKEIWQIK